MLAAVFRWGVRAAIFTALVAIGAVMAEAVVLTYGSLAHLVDGQLDLDGYIAQAIDLMILGFLVGYLAESGNHRRAEALSIARLAAKARVEVGLKGTLEAVLRELLKLFECPEVLLVASETGINRVYLWRTEALDFIREHPGRVLADAARKSAVFLADTEIPNNRSSAEERLFSPVLRLLPPPMVWLLAMGLAGLVWLGREDRRWPIVAAPILISWLTVAAFWAEDRFRFHAVPVLALSSGIWIDGLLRSVPARGVRGPATDGVGRPQAAVCGLLAIAIGAASLVLGRQFPPPAIRWDHVVWGYIKMGKVEEARALAERISLEQPENGPVWEAMGYLAAARKQYPDAVLHYQRAVALRPRSYLAHYNLAKALLALERRPEAQAEARIAVSLHPSADARALLNQAEAAP